MRKRLCTVRGLILLWGVLGALGCSQDSPTQKMLFAEKLWTQKNYSASVAEFDAVVQSDPTSALALQSLLRASMTRTLFLNRHQEALEGFKTYLSQAPQSASAPQVKKEMGEIYFSRLRQFGLAKSHYESLLSDEIWTKPERFLFELRIAKSDFQLGQVRSAAERFERLLKHYELPEDQLEIKYGLGLALMMMRDKPKNGINRATQLLQEALEAAQDLGQNGREQDIRFQLANLHEEQDQLELALQGFKSLLLTYPSPNAIKIRIHHLEKRVKAKRK